MYAQTLAFADSQFNYSATISFALGAMVFLVSYLFMFVNRRRSGLQ
jgi:multiple sugar transport system permease protein